MPWDFSNIFFGGDIYDTVLREILDVRPTGDPVKDSVYLVVLPLLTLYLFSSHVSGLMHLGKTKLKWVFMAIIFFFVVDRGFYPVLADYSLFAFIALMIWGAWTFITSPKIESEGATPPGTRNMEVYNAGSAPKGNIFSKGLGLFGTARKLTNAGNLMHEFDRAAGKEDLVTLELEKRLHDLVDHGGNPREIKELQETIAYRRGMNNRFA